MTNKSIKNSIGRPKTFEKEDVIRLAMNHFWENGYESTSLDDLLVSMGIKKSSFYRTFKSKEEVFFLALELYRKDTFALLDQLKEEMGAKETLVYLVKHDIDELLKTGKLKGCLLLDCGKESYVKHGMLSDQIQKEMDDFISFIARFIDQAQKDGQIANTLSSEKLSIRYLALYSGIITSLQAGADIRVVDDLLLFVEELLV